MASTHTEAQSDDATSAEPEDQFFWTSSSVLLSVTFALIILVAAIGNLLVLLAVLLHPKIRATTTNFFITNLALADFLLATTVMPCTAVKQVWDPYWPFGVVYCHIWYTISTWYSTASILSLCVISVDRYVGVTRPLRYPVIITRRRAMGLVLLTWVVSFMLSAPPLLIWPKWQHEPGLCVTNLHEGHVITILVGSFFLPAAIVVGVYWRVYRVVRGYEKSLHEGAIKGNESTGGNGSRIWLRVHYRGYNGQGATKAQPQSTLVVAHFQTQKRITLHLGIVGGAFLVCWAPFFTTMLFAMLQVGPGGPPPATDVAMQVVIWLGYANSCLNPFIYVASSRQFRIAFRHMLCLKEESHSQNLSE